MDYSTFSKHGEIMLAAGVVIILFVMMVPVSSTSGSAPCETLFVPLVSLAEIVMSPSSMYHVPAKAGAVRVVSIAAVRINAAAR